MQSPRCNLYHALHAWIVDMTRTGIFSTLIAVAVISVPPVPARGEDGPTAIEVIDPPASAGALAPALSTTGEAVVLTWLEPGGAGEDRTYRLLFARFADNAWSEPVTIVEHSEFFANWADVPCLAEAGDGALIATWPQKSGQYTYAYDVMVARSDDGGDSWKVLGPANDDTTPTEHGFVSLVREGSGVRAFWLDGRAMAAGDAEADAGHDQGGQGDQGGMALRTALIGRSISASEVLDDRVCECCSTAAVSTPAGPIIVYRDRSAEEVRDISIVRRAGGVWTRAQTVHADDWLIAACPVNGPAIDARGNTVVLAWYTGAVAGGAIRLAFSDDGGATFSAPAIIDDTWPVGRVGVQLTASGSAIVSWLDSDGEDGAVMLRRVHPTGSIGRPLRAATASVGRTTGFPRIAVLGSRVLLVWTDQQRTTRLRAVTVPITAIE